MNLKNAIKKMHIGNILSLSSYALAGQIISLVVQPIASRVYTPAEIGCLSIFTSLLSMFVPLYTMQYDYCIISAREEKEAQTYVKLSLLINMLSSVILGLGIIIFNLIERETFADIGYWIYFVPLAMFISGYTSSITSYNTRNEEYKIIGRAGFLRSIFQNVSKILFGVLHFKTIGLFISYFIGIFSGLRMQSKRFFTVWKQIMKIPLSDVKKAALEQKKQPLFSMPGVFFITASNSIVVFGLKSLYSLDVAGQYSMAVTLLMLPISLVSTNIGKIFFRNASVEYHASGSFRKYFLKNILLLSVLGVIPFFTLAVIGEWLFTLVLGSQWMISGQMAQYMTAWFYFYFVVGALMSGFILTGKQLGKMILQFVFILWTISSIVVSNYFELHYMTYIQLISFGFAFIYVIMAIFLFYFSGGKHEKNRNTDFSQGA